MSGGNTMANEKDKKKIILWLIVLSMLAAAAFTVTAIVRHNQRPAWDGGYSVHISEVMTDNKTCPNGEGVLCDWIEIENTSSEDFSIGGYYLSDETGKGKYCFPAGTVVPARGYLVVWCSPDEEGDYAPFALRRAGGETVCLMNENRTVLDSAVTAACRSGQSLVRGGDGALVPADTPTPGFPNSEAGAKAWQEALAQRSGGTLALSEIMSSNTLYAAPDGNFHDWIEVYNPTDLPVSLSGYKLSDRTNKTKYTFPDEMLGAGEYRIVWCAPGLEGAEYAPFALASAGGETVVLTAPSGAESESVELPMLEKNTVYARENGEWTVSQRPTPGYSNDDAGYEAWLRSDGYENDEVYITEVMAHNCGTLADSDGDLSDWIEIANFGETSVDLAGWYLSDDPDAPDEWKIPPLTLAPGEYAVIFASGKNRAEGELHTSFSLTDGDTVLLSRGNGAEVCRASIENAEEGASLAMRPDGSFAMTDFPTPGFENTAEGYAEFCETDTRTSPLLLWEIVVYEENSSDWVKLKNVSAQPVDLSGYTLSDKFREPARDALPAVTLAPGESCVFDCENVGLNAQRDALYLFDGSGALCDWAFLREIPAGGSYGREDGESGYFYFAQSSRGADNGAGYRFAAGQPTVDVAAGVYDDAESLTLTLAGENVHYTLDGSDPTEDAAAYTAPITITETTVVRAASFPADALPSKTATWSYFLRENSTLPIVSLVTDPDNLTGPQGIYTNHEQAWSEKWEREATVAMYEDGGGFTIDCGIRMHGRTSRRVSEKKSFTLKFRGRYGGELSYDVFGDGAVTDFSSLLLRASVEDTYTSYMRDEFFARIAMDYTDVPAQNYRYVSLFLNGEYWGIYAIREHHSAEYFASHYGVDAETVDMQTGEFEGQTAWSELLNYARYHDLTSAEGWAYIQEHLDVPEMIDWLILECWSGDIDVYENVRFYASPDYENGRYLYGLADMDLTMMGTDTMSVGFNNFQLHGIIPAALRGNAEFRDMFLTRLGEMLRGPLSDENAQKTLDELRAVVEPETARDLARWNKPSTLFATQMANLRDFVSGRAEVVKNGAIAFFGVSAEDAAKYFA